MKVSRFVLSYLVKLLLSCLSRPRHQEVDLLSPPITHPFERFQNQIWWPTYLEDLSFGMAINRLNVGHSRID